MGYDSHLITCKMSIRLEVMSRIFHNDLEMRGIIISPSWKHSSSNVIHLGFGFGKESTPLYRTYNQAYIYHNDPITQIEDMT